MAKKIIPINRLNKFFSADDFSFDIEVGREYLEGDINMRIVLYQVDRVNSVTDDIYGETDKGGIRFRTPVEIPVLPTLAKPENKVYNGNSGSLRYLQDGQLSFGVYDSQLKELNVDISFGDYIGYAVTETEMRYYTVVNDGRKNYDNAHTIGGYKGFFRSVVCAPVDESEFNSL